MTYKPIAVHTLIRSIANRLYAQYRNRLVSTQYAWWMLETITQTTKSNLLLQNMITMNTDQSNQIELWITKQVQEQMPLQYLIGSVPFVNCTILVEPPTLIPRPETEEWCYNLIEQLQSFSSTSLRIADLCTGSGCIAIALAKALPQASIYATDIAHKALELARRNAVHNQVNNITFIQSDLFENITDLTFDIIIANPPYISSDEWHMLDHSVRTWEDKRALIADQQGTALIKNIIKQAAHYIQPHPELLAKNIPQLIVEIGPTQANSVKNFFNNTQFSNNAIKKDMYGNDRIAVGYGAYEVHAKS